ncbi:MAG: hypothetical protein NW207_03225 [Cytophagales bacterium]|nr:hypothetical protein [Cytophagales bacterium]
MKILFHTLIIFIYLIFSGGITLHKHYCGGELVSVKLMPQHKSCASCGSKSKKCCENIIKTLKSDDCKVSTLALFHALQIDLPKHIFVPALLLEIIHVQMQYYSTINTPPKVPVFIKYRTIIV